MTHTFKYTLGVMIFALTLFMGMTTIALADEESDAQKAIDNAKDTRVDLDKLIFDADAYSGIDTDEAEDASDEGGELIFDAELEFDSNDFDEAKDLADEAQELMEDAYDDLEDQMSAEADEALDLARKYMKAAEELLEDADEEDLDYDDAEDLYEDAQEDMDLAEEEYDDKNFQWAEDYARDVIEYVEDMFHELDTEIEYYLLEDDEVEEAIEEAEMMLGYAEMALDEANQNTYGYEVSSGLYTKAYDKLEEANDAFDDKDYPVAYAAAAYVIDAAEEIFERLKRDVSEFEGREVEDDEDEDATEEETDDEVDEVDDNVRLTMLKQLLALLMQLLALQAQQ